jgi:hypothetical protein
MLLYFTFMRPPLYSDEERSPGSNRCDSKPTPAACIVTTHSTICCYHSDTIILPMQYQNTQTRYLQLARGTTTACHTRPSSWHSVRGLDRYVDADGAVVAPAALTSPLVLRNTTVPGAISPSYQSYQPSQRKSCKRCQPGTVHVAHLVPNQAALNPAIPVITLYATPARTSCPHTHPAARVPDPTPTTGKMPR